MQGTTNPGEKIPAGRLRTYPIVIASLSSASFTRNSKNRVRVEDAKDNHRKNTTTFPTRNRPYTTIMCCRRVDPEVTDEYLQDRKCEDSTHPSHTSSYVTKKICFVHIRFISPRAPAPSYKPTNLESSPLPHTGRPGGSSG